MPPDAPSKSFWIIDHLVTFIVTGEETGGQYSLFDLFAPPETGTTPHIHTMMGEGFYVLEGEVTFQRENTTITATPGTFVNLPAGTIHAYRNLGETPARMLVSASPEGLEHFIAETGRPATDPSLPPPLDDASRERILAAFVRNHTVPLDSLIFADTEFSINEDGTPIAAVTVLRPLEVEGAVGATITLGEGTATHSEDYSGSQIPVNFADGEGIQTVAIPLIDDNRVESNETIELTLSDPTGSTIIGLLQDTAILSVVDNDARPEGESGTSLIGGDSNDTLVGGDGSEAITGQTGNDTLTGGGNQDLFTVGFGDGTDTVIDFGGVGTGARPSPAVSAEVDTLKFDGTGLTAENMFLTQDASNLLITFDGVEETGVILQDFDLENLDNLRRTTGASVDIGNILFDGQTAFQDSFDIFNATSQRSRVFNQNSVTFLNDLDNKIRGFNGSDDVINGQGGNDQMRGLSGNDLLRGGHGNDTLVGGFGSDTLFGGFGSDLFVYTARAGIDTIMDFTNGRDLIGLSGGLSFADLRLAQGTGGSANNTLISIASSNELLAVLSGVQSSTISNIDFSIV